MQNIIEDTKRRYENELLNVITPFWQKNSPDHDNGGFFSCLDRKGEIYDTAKYMWMQWRNVYMFATMYKTQYSDPEWLKLAEKGFDFLMKYGKQNNGSYYFSLDKNGKPLCADFGGFSIFSDSFAAIGAAALFNATGKEKYRNEANSAARTFMKNIRKSQGNEPGSLKQLGHYMIFLNVGYLLNKYLITNEYDSEIRDSVDNIMSFWNEETGFMFETIRVDGALSLYCCDGRLVNPGHALEAMWFIMQYADSQKNKALAEKACFLTGKILDYGWDKINGGIYYFRDALDKPLLEVKTYFKIWWAHCEAAVAAFFAYKMSGDPKFLEWFLKIDEWSWAHFNDPEYGEWFGYVDPAGKVCHSFKGSNWKTFFHLPRYLLTCINLCSDIINKEKEKGE